MFGLSAGEERGRERERLELNPCSKYKRAKLTPICIGLGAAGFSSAGFGSICRRFIRKVSQMDVQSRIFPEETYPFVVEKMWYGMRKNTDSRV